MRESLSALLACAALGCAGQSHPVVAQEPRPTVLTGNELRALFSKKLAVRNSGAGVRATTSFYEPDGTARLEDGQNLTVYGSWRIADDKFCTDYSRLGAGCSHIHKTGEKTYREIPFERGGLGRTWEILN